VWSLGGRPAAGRRSRSAQSLQRRASTIVQLALLMFIAKLGLLSADRWPSCHCCWALVFRNSSLLRTMALGLPIALLLGIKREAIGATFSVGREPSLAMIARNTGCNRRSRGVLAEYITGRSSALSSSRCWQA